MTAQPTLETERLRLRPFTLDDAPAVQRLAGDRAIADTTLNIPHPYEDGMAEEWIQGHPDAFAAGEGATFAVALKKTGALVGAIGLRINKRFNRAELGYWTGKPYWNRGYATEAAKAVLAFGFREMDLHRIYASFLSRNPASGRVMQKAGMTYEGRFRHHVKKWGEYEDLMFYSILKHEFEALAKI